MAEKKNLFERILEIGDAQLDLFLAKSKAKTADLQEDDAYYRKSIYKDLTYSVGIGGYTEKTSRLSYYFLRQISLKDAVIAAIIQTRQNQVAAYAKAVTSKFDMGFRFVLKNEEEILSSILDSLDKQEAIKLGDSSRIEASEDDQKLLQEPLVINYDEFFEDLKDGISTEEQQEVIRAKESKEFIETEKRRRAKEILNKEIKPRIHALTNVIEHCGFQSHRPFESRKWTFDAFIRAIVRDSLTYDQYAIEIIYDNAGRFHHFVPVDGGTIRYSTIDLKNYKNFSDINHAYDILYPEKEIASLQESDALDLDEQKLKDNEYKFVQVIDGKVERAFTEKELAMGMRNLTTDLWANGYSIAELEQLIGIISSHLFTENYNKQYFHNGFAAKGILHVKGNIPRRKAESIRVMWQHMIKGNRKSFQTPIITDPGDINWIPLNQGHKDMEFTTWLQYLIRLICSVMQIDPLEIGLGMREMGDSGAALSGDNSAIKLIHSKSKGLVPLIKHIENFINKNIIDKIDPDFKLEFVGVDNEGRAEAIERQMKEVRYKKTVNEIREEDGLPPIPGMDHIILDNTYMMAFNLTSPIGRAINDENEQKQLENQLMANAALQEGAEEEPISKKEERNKDNPKHMKDSTSKFENLPKNK